MSEQSERLARQIRKSLGEHNDDNEPVIILVERLRREAEEYKDLYNEAVASHIAANQRIEELEGALREAIDRMGKARTKLTRYKQRDNWETLKADDLVAHLIGGE